jgi:phosphate transport system substrate-binding protein
MFNKKLVLSITLGLVLSFVLLLAAMTAGWAADPSLTGAGATFPYPLYSKWIAVYHEQTGVSINYQSIGSGGGIQQLKAGTVDFGASDAPLSNDEMKAMPGAVVHIPTVAGAVAVIYNVPGVGRGLHLDADTMAGIFLGNIKNWNDRSITRLNPSFRLPNLPIAVIHRSDGSGTSYIFTNYLAAVNGAWKTKVGAGKSVNWPVGLGGKGNEGIASLVRQTPGGIGYVELAYAIQNRLSFAALRNRSGNFIEPNIDSTISTALGAVKAMRKDVRVSIVNSAGADAYPIAGFTYIIVYVNQKDKAKGAATVKFLRWAIHDGQKYASSLLYAPLPADVVKINDAALKTIK